MKLPHGSAEDHKNGWKLSHTVLEQISNKIKEKEFDGYIPSLEQIEDVLLAYYEVSKYKEGLR